MGAGLVQERALLRDLRVDGGEAPVAAAEPDRGHACGGDLREGVATARRLAVGRRPVREDDREGGRQEAQTSAASRSTPTSISSSATMLYESRTLDSPRPSG